MIRSKLGSFDTDLLGKYAQGISACIRYKMKSILKKKRKKNFSQMSVALRDESNEHD
jgi:uncharacterized OsmC-like protein